MCAWGNENMGGEGIFVGARTTVWEKCVSGRRRGRGMERDLLAMQAVLAIPASKGARDIDALAWAVPLNQRGDGRAARVRLELIAEIEVVVVGRGGAEHRGALGQGALDVAMVNGARQVLGRDDGRAGRLHLLLNGQRQTRRAVEVGSGEEVVRGAGGDEGSVGVGIDGRVNGQVAMVVWVCTRLWAGSGRHVDGACVW